MNDVRTQLESQGYRFIANYGSAPGQDGMVPDQQTPSVLRSQLINHFHRKGYSDVRTTDAYTAGGEQIQDMIAVYVRGDAQPLPVPAPQRLGRVVPKELAEGLAGIEDFL